MVWYSHLFNNFPQFVVVHIVKGFSVVNEAEVVVYLEFSCFFYEPADVFLEFSGLLYDPTNVGNLISGSSAFSKPSLYILEVLSSLIAET